MVLPVKFHEMSLEEKLRFLKKHRNLSDKDIQTLSKGLSVGDAGRFAENVIAVHGLPLGIATNFRVNGKDYLVPMAIEESSVIAAASNGAKHALPDGFQAEWNGNITVGMIQLKTSDAAAAKSRLQKLKKEIMAKADEIFPSIVERGGGASDVEVSVVSTPNGSYVIVYIHFDTVDAMGANTINTICEKIAPWLADEIDGSYILRILSNHAPEKIARARAVFSKELLGKETIGRIIDAYALACADIRRAATHNKGIMNGIDAVAIATGNDWRALEAGAHAYAARNGKYSPLTKYERDETGNLVGSIEVPIQVGTVGGITSIHPTARLALKILGVNGARELACVMAAVGLAQNFAAIRALAAEGIQEGHMKLHAVNLAMAAGAEGAEAEEIARRMAAEGKISMERAQELLIERGGRKGKKKAK